MNQLSRKLGNKGKFLKIFLVFILFTHAYNVWVISPPFPMSLPPLPAPPFPPLPLATPQKLFCPYLQF
jgi:hypothetical protein